MSSTQQAKRNIGGERRSGSNTQKMALKWFFFPLCLPTKKGNSGLLPLTSHNRARWMFGCPDLEEGPLNPACQKGASQVQEAEIEGGGLETGKRDGPRAVYINWTLAKVSLGRKITR